MCRSCWLHAGICLVRWESEFNTSAIGSLNADGSLDHGLFQISDRYWCDHEQGMEGACGLSCNGKTSFLIFHIHFIIRLLLLFTHLFSVFLDLRNDDIKDDVICAKRIFRQHQHLYGNGFNAWYELVFIFFLCVCRVIRNEIILNYQQVWLYIEKILRVRSSYLMVMTRYSRKKTLSFFPCSISFQSKKERKKNNRNRIVMMETIQPETAIIT